jgi:hypothetical protein
MNKWESIESWSWKCELPVDWQTSSGPDTWKPTTSKEDQSHTLTHQGSGRD